MDFYLLFLFLDVIPRLKKAFFKFVKLIPHVRKKIDSEMSKLSEGFEKDVSERTKSLKYITKLPKEGLSTSQVLQVTNENLGLGKRYIVFAVCSECVNK